MPVARTGAAVVVVLTCLAVVVGDLATKALVRRELGGGRVVELPFGARLEHGENRGVAFGLLAGAGDVVLVVALIAVAGFALMLLTRPALTASASLAAALLVGGGLANVVDRAGDGAVTDFIDLGRWPAFNLADIAITLGVALFAASLARSRPSGAEREQPRALSAAHGTPTTSGRADRDGQGSGRG